MTEPRKIAHFGWIPDQPDQRDHLYAAPAQFLSALPARADLRACCPEVYNQGALGSCTANAIGGAMRSLASGGSGSKYDSAGWRRSLAASTGK